MEDPNQYVRDMLDDIKDGINDRFIVFALEPLAHGFHVTSPYGSWLQNQVKDAFWPDLRILKKLGLGSRSGKRFFREIPWRRSRWYMMLQMTYENLMSEPDDEKTTKPDLAEGEELGRQGAFAQGWTLQDLFDLVQQLSNENVLYNVVFEEPGRAAGRGPPVGLPKGHRSRCLLDGRGRRSPVKAFAENGGEVIAVGRTVEALSSFRNVAASE